MNESSKLKRLYIMAASKYSKFISIISILFLDIYTLFRTKRIKRWQSSLPIK